MKISNQLKEKSYRLDKVEKKNKELREKVDGLKYNSDTFTLFFFKLLKSLLTNVTVN